MIEDVIEKVLKRKFDEIKIEKLKDNELLTRADVAKEILHCSTITADREYLYKKDFPYVMKGKRRMYPRQGVNQWITDHTRYVKEVA